MAQRTKEEMLAKVPGLPQPDHLAHIAYEGDVWTAEGVPVASVGYATKGSAVWTVKLTDEELAVAQNILMGD